MAFEIETALLSFGGVIVGGAISSVTTILLNRAERAKFVRERFWDARQEAYTRTISIVFANERHAAKIHYLLPDKDRGEGYYLSDRFRSDAEAASKLFKELMHTFAHHRLMMSRTFAERVEKLISQIERLGDDLNDIPDEQHRAYFEAYTQASRDILAIGQDELGTPA